MKITVQMKWDGVRPEQYEKLRKLVKWEEDVPKGQLSHTVAFYNNVARVADIWESANDFQQFPESRILPAVAQLKIEGQPEVEIFPAHAIFVRRSERFV
jgi:hypothetical protein